MKRGKKLQLRDLKIRSFVTTLTEEEIEKIHGKLLWESGNTCPDDCGTTAVAAACTSPCGSRVCIG